MSASPGGPAAFAADTAPKDKARPTAESDQEQVFTVTTRTARGVQRVRHARAVVLAIGYYDHPNYINVPGEDLPHVTHAYHEGHHAFQQDVVVVGGGNSAAEAALDLVRDGAVDDRVRLDVLLAVEHDLVD